MELTALQKQYYRAIFERNHAFLYNKAGSRGLLPKLMNIQMELRKCCNHPFLVEGVEESEMYVGWSVGIDNVWMDAPTNHSISPTDP